MVSNGLSKVCYGCKVEKPLSEFHQDKTRSDGRRHECGVCRNEVGYIKRPLDETFFDEWSSHMAWLLGYIWADGYVGERSIEFQIQRQDGDILNIIQHLLGSTYQIEEGERKTNYGFVKFSRLRIGSTKIADRLRQLQVKAEVLPFIPINMVSHFVRGYFDGDGCVTFSGLNHHLKVVFLGKKEFLISLRDRICEVVDVRVARVYEATRTWRMDWAACRDVNRLANWMYFDAGNHCLLRKKRRFEGGDVLSLS